MIGARPPAGTAHVCSSDEDGDTIAGQPFWEVLTTGTSTAQVWPATQRMSADHTRAPQPSPERASDKLGENSSQYMAWPRTAFIRSGPSGYT
jgi:hypothetical protein